MKHFRFSIIFSIICLGLAAYWGYHNPAAGQTAIAAMLSALFIAFVLSVMEVSLSFDNAVVNASVLRNWDEFWKKLFLTVGILIAVFGMRLIFPIAIVAFTADMSWGEVTQLALNNPKEYSARLIAHHHEISAFGGMFLLLVFLNFFFDDSKDEHWFAPLEARMARLGSVDAISIFLAMVILMVMMSLVADTEKFAVLQAGIWGILVYVGVKTLGHLLEGSGSDTADGENSPVTAPSSGKIVKAGIGGFLYLEVLDASFSFDGVIGAFAITSDVVIIMLGLAIGAIFVRSMTVYLVEKGTLEAYQFLEHGAHYAIGALAAIMLLSVKFHVPEVITGLIGVAFIIWSVLASIAYRKKHGAA